MHTSFTTDAACMAKCMDSQKLHSHLGYYLRDKELRDKIVSRVKRPVATSSSSSSSSSSGCGRDQCYFTGALKLLQQVDTLDFVLLYSGQLSVEDLDRVKRIARTSILKLPYFMQDTLSYLSALKEIKRENVL